MIGRSRLGLPTALVIAVFSIGPSAASVEAQDRVSDLAERPILVLDTGGHSAPVRKLLFTNDEAKLLSAGDDKVVRVWDLAVKTPALAWTIRPPIWRGSAGAIKAMALGPPDVQGRQTLALAGFGIGSQRGEIGLYRFPGEANRRQGDIEAYLAAGDRVPLLESKGHFNSVTGLAFSPDGTILASSGNDETVRLWDHREKKHLAVLATRGQAKVNALAFTPDGRRLVTGGSDGTIRIWDVATRSSVPLAQVAPRIIAANDVEGLAINTLIVTLDGRWVVIGREDGALIRYDLAAPDLKASERLCLTKPFQQGPVEGLAAGPGGLIACSIVAQRNTPAGKPTVACDIELRQVADPDRVERVDGSTNLVYALAFSPKGSFLAYAGGDRQDVSLVDLRVSPRRPADVSGRLTMGMSVWDVGFVGNTSVAYSYEQPAAAPPSMYFGFDLKGRSKLGYPAAVVSRALKTLDGWSVQPVGPYRLEVSRGGVGFPVVLTADFDGRWWDYSFISAGPTHPKPLLAIACDRCVVVYRLEDKVRTRVLDGHNGAVYCLAPSPDGKWLATGSSDQTIRLWTLAGADIIAPLGAEFERIGAELTVKSVVRSGFADLSGMKAGDVVDTPALLGKPVTPEEFLKGYPSVPPNSRIEYRGHRSGVGGVREDVLLGTSKRDRPSLSLFVGLDGEWVFWMPRGFYDSSVIGDSTFLGWQVNRYSATRPIPTDYYPILTHEKTLRQPRALAGNKIDALLDAADESVVLGIGPTEQETVVETDRPAIVTPILGAGGAEVKGPDGRTIAVGAPLPEAFTVAPGPLVVAFEVEPRMPQPLGPFEVRLEGETIRPPQPPPPIEAADGRASIPVRYDLSTPGSYQFTGLSDVGGGHERKVSFTATVQGEPPKNPARVRVLPIAPAFVDPKIRPVLGSDRDARDLSKFFAKYLVTEAGNPFDMAEPVEAGLTGKGATGEKILAALAKLGREPVVKGDLAVVVLETYIIASSREKSVESRLVVSDSQGVLPSRESTIPAEAVGAALEALVRRGCKVILVLDGTPETPGWGMNADVLEWTRTLRNQYDVITIVATTRRPIRDTHVDLHRPLAQAILDSIRSSPGPRDPLMTLADLRAAIIQRVQRLTAREGEPMIYIPKGIDPGLPILNRRP